MILNLIKFVLVMAPDIHGVNKNKKFLLSNYPLTYQLFFINLIISFIGFTFLLIFNFYLIQNDRNISLDYEYANTKISQIPSFQHISL